MALVIGNVRAGAVYADNVQLELTLITGLNLADARFYNKYNLVLLKMAVINLLFSSERQIRR